MTEKKKASTTPASRKLARSKKVAKKVSKKSASGGAGDTSLPLAEGEGGATAQVSFADALSERYLTYALSTITARSLPDARDGLKPVHRRLLYAMLHLRLQPTQPFRKSARIVGDVIGRFHPHNEVSIYEALVRLAQPFSMRFPLVEGQGNFGAIDGDAAAAMRYTEARMTPFALLLLDGIEEDAVAFRATYDGSEREPTVLPGGFPNLLANGSQGIAVGMACSIPPHNLYELIQGLRRLLRAPTTSHADLMADIPGPDFPTGGVLCESAETLSEAYRTGRGQLRLRARWRREPAERGRWRIIVYEIPYQVAKSRLIAQLAILLDDRKLPGVRRLRDESDEEIRIVLEPADGEADAEALMERLFRLSELEVRVSVNMNALDAEGRPHLFSLGELLQVYLDHRLEVLLGRSRFQLGVVERRLELVDGFLQLFDNLTLAINIIREHEEPAAELAKRFSLSARQVEAVLDLRLRALRRLEEGRLRDERAALLAEQKRLGALLGNKKLQRDALDAELAALGKAYGPKTETGARRTELAQPPASPEAAASPLAPGAAGEGEALQMVLSRKDWVRVMRAGADTDALRFREGDGLRSVIAMRAGDRLAVLASNGRCYPLEASALPGARGYGESLRLLAALPEDMRVVDVLPLRAGARALVASSDGRGFIVPHEALFAHTRNGVSVLLPVAGAEAVALVGLETGHDLLVCMSDDKRVLAFPLAEVAERRRGQGVILQRQRAESSLAAVAGVASAEGLAWLTASGMRRREPDLSPWHGRRSQVGRAPPRGLTPAALRATAARAVVPPADGFALPADTPPAAEALED